MKTILLAGAALALIAGSASAQSYGTATYGNDGIAVWQLNADVDTFCKLGAVPTTRRSNATVTPGDNGRGGTAANGDGTIDFNIQNPSNNTIQAAAAAVTYAQSQCNTTFNVTAQSENGGLENNDFASFDTEFTDLVPYNVGIVFDGANGYQGNLSGTSTLISNQQPTAGDFEIRVNVAQNTNELLLEGEYTDYLIVTMQPVV